MMNNKVFIVICEGLVKDIYSDTETLDIEVIDLDTDSPERKEEAESALLEVRKDYENGKLFQIL